MRTFCLTLPEKPQRTAKAKDHFNALTVRNVEFFDAIHAEKAGLATIHPYEVDHPGSGFKMGFGPTGCMLGHYMLWGALNLLWDEHFLILEDDAKFPEDWHTRFTQAMNDTPPDFDMLYVGSCCCAGRPQTQIKGEVWEVKYPLCTHAYIVAKKALPILLKAHRKFWAPIDIAMTMESHPQMKVYTVLPRIVEQFDTVIPP